ncbi:MAG: DUF3343 domain-containing protein [Longimicrobiales bacterium]
MSTRIFTFDTTHHALWAEQIALELLLGAQVIPAPAAANAKCSLALEVLDEDADSLRAALDEQGVVYRPFP